MNELIIGSGRAGGRLGSADPYMPTPDPRTGELFVDPEIVLKAKGFDLEIKFYYSSVVNQGFEYGQGRSSSARAFVQYAPGFIPTVCHGDFHGYPYSAVSESGGVTNYVPVAIGPNAGGVTTLQFDGTNFTEYYNDGFQLEYTSTGATANKYELSRVKHPTGAAHTYLYDTGPTAGFLVNIQEPAGRLVSFSYAAGLLSTIEDWGGRVWSFGYDAYGDLTECTTPVGCQTRYGYVFNGRGKNATLLSWIENPLGFVTC
jgi:YD repeat-containing protein